jgi:hypothetical protein
MYFYYHILHLLLQHALSIVLLGTETGGYNCVRKTYNVICGVSELVQPQLTKEQQAEQLKLMTNIEEDPLWARLSDYNAVAAIGFTCFIIGFFA